MWLNVVVCWLVLLLRIRKELGSDLGPKFMHVGRNQRLLVFNARGSTVEYFLTGGFSQGGVVSTSPDPKLEDHS
jgi:hypothetical protein